MPLDCSCSTYAGSNVFSIKDSSSAIYECDTQSPYLSFNYNTISNKNQASFSSPVLARGMKISLDFSLYFMYNSLLFRNYNAKSI